MKNLITLVSLCLCVSPVHLIDLVLEDSSHLHLLCRLDVYFWARVNANRCNESVIAQMMKFAANYLNRKYRKHNNKNVVGM